MPNDGDVHISVISVKSQYRYVTLYTLHQDLSLRFSLFDFHIIYDPLKQIHIQ